MLALFSLFVLLSYTPLNSAVLGIDFSLQACEAGIPLSTWQCWAKAGYSFAIIEIWNGGFQINSKIAQCVSDAWQAGFAHVDVYVFMCPNCGGNNPASSVIDKINATLDSQRIRYGMLWFDVEQCTGCWNSDLNSNGNWLSGAVSRARQLGIAIGFYSSEYEWGVTMGSYSAFSSYPLWYADWDGQLNYNDNTFRFGGWTQPALKQYADHNPSGCGPDTDLNWYP